MIKPKLLAGANDGVLQTVPISPPQLMNQIEIRVAEIELAWAKLPPTAPIHPQQLV
jgi:hypothetical protein